MVYSPHHIDEDVAILADPFITGFTDGVFLFYEMVCKGNPHGRIGVSAYDDETDQWRFLGVALSEPFHLSYPHVFSHDGEMYMLPETKQAREVRLYKASEFPLHWELEQVLLSNIKRVDPSIIRHENRWYLFASRKRKLDLFVSDSLTGVWTKHPRSPVKRRNHARNAGRILSYGGNLYRFAQEQVEGYGSRVYAYHIMEMSPTSYREERLRDQPVLEPIRTGWAQRAMHHLDMLLVADGDGYMGVFDGEGLPGKDARGRSEAEA